MGRVRAAVEVSGTTAEAEALWFDVRRWPSFLDGFGHVVRNEAGWPRTGGTLVWDSGPHGRGRVVERVTDYVEGRHQVAAVEDPRLRGTQTVAFEALADGVAVSLALEYELKQGPAALRVLIDPLFIRRAIRDSLRRTVVRFGRELEADRELMREHGSR